MCSAVLVLSLLAAIDPVRIGITALLISRPRPMLNLLAFWLGGIATGIGVALAVLFLLRDVMLSVMRTVVSATHSPTVAYAQVGLGALALSSAALLVARSWVRRRSPVPVTAGDSSVLLRERHTPPAGGRLTLRRRLEGGSLAVAFAAGAALATPPVEYMAVILAILASEPAVPEQFGAALMFTVVAFTVVEIPLVTYLTAPAQTLSVVQRMNKWIIERRQAIPGLIVGALGFMLLASGIGRV
ncbi:MAG: GAP family protein [Mycobacterium sp.]